MEKNYVRDNFEISYQQNNDSNAIDNMLEFLKERSNNSAWLDVEIGDTSFDVIPNGPLFLNVIKENYKLKVSDLAIEDTQSGDGISETGGSQFVLRTKSRDENYLLSDTALNGVGYSFIGAITNFKKLDKALQKEALDIFSNASPGKILRMLVSGEKIRAVQSHRYAPLDQYILFKNLIGVLSDKVERKNLYMAYGSYSHNSTNAVILINNSELLQKYLETYNDSNILKENETVIPYVYFNTADVGTASAKVSAGFKIDDDEIELGDLISVDHLAGNSTETFSNELDGLFAAYDDLSEKLMGLIETKIKNPLSTLKNFMKSAGFNDEIITSSSEEFLQLIPKNKDGKAICTANDIFIYAHRVASKKNQEGKITDKSLVKIRENITRGLSKRSWVEHDRPSDQ